MHDITRISNILRLILGFYSLNWQENRTRQAPTRPVKRTLLHNYPAICVAAPQPYITLYNDTALTSFARCYTCVAAMQLSNYRGDLRFIGREKGEA